MVPLYTSCHILIIFLVSSRSIPATFAILSFLNSICAYSAFCKANKIRVVSSLADRCSMPLGMEDRRILAGHLRASSSYNYNHGPDRARLNMINAHSRTGGWMAKYRNQKQWLQIDCRQMSIIKGIATQGRRAAHYWVSSYDLSYGVDGRRFKAYSVGGRIKVRYMKQ